MSIKNILMLTLLISLSGTYDAIKAKIIHSVDLPTLNDTNIVRKSYQLTRIAENDSLSSTTSDALSEDPFTINIEIDDSDTFVSSDSDRRQAWYLTLITIFIPLWMQQILQEE